MSSPWSSMMCGCLIVCSLSVPRLVPFRVSLLSLALLFPLLPVLCPEPLPPCGKANIPCAFAKWGVWAPGRIHHRLGAQAPWRLPLLGDCWNHLPGRIQRQRRGALVLAWRGTRRWDLWESALFTIVHSGARRTSGPKTSLSLLWRKFCCQHSLFFAHTSTGRPVYEPSSSQKRKCGRDMENETIRILLERQKEQIIADFRAEIQKTRVSSRFWLDKYPGINWNYWVSAKRNWPHSCMWWTNNFDEINCFFMNNYQNKIGIFVKLIWKVLMRWKNWCDFKGQHF